MGKCNLDVSLETELYIPDRRALPFPIRFACYVPADKSPIPHDSLLGSSDEPCLYQMEQDTKADLTSRPLQLPTFSQYFIVMLLCPFLPKNPTSMHLLSHLMEAMIPGEDHAVKTHLSSCSVCPNSLASTDLWISTLHLAIIQAQNRAHTCDLALIQHALISSAVPTSRFS